MADKTPTEQARDKAIASAVDTLVYIGIVTLISVAIAKRDVVVRAWMRLQRLRDRRDPYAREVAEFRRDIADISRGSAGPDTTRSRGLYERP